MVSFATNDLTIMVLAGNTAYIAGNGSPAKRHRLVPEQQQVAPGVQPKWP